MARKLPEDPVKRRLQVFKRLFQHIEHWHALMEAGEMGSIITTPEGEEIFLYDLMTGIDTLPPRQRQAFDLICIQSFTESAATAIMLPDSKWSTPIQQYADAALLRMVQAYDAKQNGTWNPTAIKKRKAPKTKEVVSHDDSVSRPSTGPERDAGKPVEPVPYIGPIECSTSAEGTPPDEGTDANPGAGEEDCPEGRISFG